MSQQVSTLATNNYSCLPTGVVYREHPPFDKSLSPGSDDSKNIRNNHGTMSVPQRVSLRDAAAARAAGMASSSSSGVAGINSSLASSENGMPFVMSTTTRITRTSEDPENAPSPQDARKMWRLHGEGVTQAMEERRAQLHRGMSSHNNNAMVGPPSAASTAAAAAALYNESYSSAIALPTSTASFPPEAPLYPGTTMAVQYHDYYSNPTAPSPSTTPNTSGAEATSSTGDNYSVRVISAETRRDYSGSPYTAYLVCVKTHQNPQSIIEHRYSEFAKLHRELTANNVRLRAAFPGKHWAGRMGNWTPSAKLAPERREELIVFRKVKLDIWLVELCELLGRGDLIGGVREQVLEFLSVSASSRPPCDRANHVSWDGLATASAGSATLPSLRKYEEMLEGRRHAAGAEKHISNPISFTLGSSIRQATYTVMHMCGKRSTISDSDQSIPLDLLHQAKGLVFLSVFKAGFLVSGRVGTGLIIARHNDGNWSPPSAVGTFGIGWGLLFGGDITTYLIVLNTPKAVAAFATKNGTVNLGAELGVAVGPVGRSATGNLNASGGKYGGLVPAYAYAHSKGLFAGISVEGSIVASRPDVNAKFYGRSLDAAALLFGREQSRPRAAQPLYDALNEALGVQIPSDGFRPSLMFEDKNERSSTLVGSITPPLSTSSSMGDVPHPHRTTG